MGKKKKARKKAKSNTKRILRCWEADNLLVRYSAPRVVSFKTLCVVCHAEMSGEWVGEPPYCLVCGNCCMSYTVAVGAGVQ